MNRLNPYYIFFIILFAISALFSQDVHLKISDSGIEKIHIAVLDFVPEDDNYSEENYVMMRLLTDVLAADVNFSPFFAVVDTIVYPTRRISNEKEIDFFKWTNIRTEFLIYGKFQVKNGELIINTEIFSIMDTKRIFKKTYTGDERQSRRMIHAISDDLCQLLTGEEGVSQTQICYVSDRSGTKEVFVCDYDGFGTRQITSDGAITLAPAWSPAGDYITYTSYKDGNPDLYVYDVYKRTERKVSSYPGLNVQAAWSPDSRAVAVCLSKDGNSELYLVDIRTGNVQRLTHNWGIDTNPCFSPTGDEIAFTSDRSGSPQIYIMDVTGSNVRRLTYNGKYNDLASWSPKGDKIAFCTRMHGLFQIATIDVTGDNMAILTSIGSNESPSWSPDGYHITFSSNRLGTPQVYHMNWDGTDIRRITNSKGRCLTPKWSSRYRWKFY